MVRNVPDVNSPKIAFYSKGRLRGWRRVAFPVAAIVLALTPFIILETVLRVLDLGNPRGYTDPFVGFSSIHPLFEKDEAAGVYVTALSRQLPFGAQRFAVRKPANGFRAFCFGGSTVRGHPYETDTAFSKWLELELQSTDPSRHYEIVNCGGVSYASYRLLPIVQEVLDYQPDLIVVAAGQNEFLEDRTYQALKSRSPVQTWLEDRVFSLRSVTVARRALDTARATADQQPGRTTLSTEVDARLDKSSGYASYHRDDAWRAGVVEHYRQCVRAMVAACRARQVPVFLINLGTNLRDCPPFKSEHQPGLTREQELTWQAAYDTAVAADTAWTNRDLALTRYQEPAGSDRVRHQPGPSARRGSPDPAADQQELAREGLPQILDRYRTAEAIDGEYALLAYRIARCLDRLGRYDEARTYYQKAQDEDVCPLRMVCELHDAMKASAAETGAPLINVELLLARQSPQGISGNNWYVDHVHPTFGGHQQMAQAILEEMHRQGLVSDRSGHWDARQRYQAYRDHFRQLTPTYIADGRQRVGWLEHWAQRQRLAEESRPIDARGFLHQGHRFLEFGRAEEAGEAYQTALALDPQLQDTLVEHARQLVAQGRPGAAQDIVELLRKRTPSPALLEDLDLAALVIALEVGDEHRAREIYTAHRAKLRELQGHPHVWLELVPDALERAEALSTGKPGG